LIERLLHESNDQPCESRPSTSHSAVWDDIEAFERNTILEVEQKLHQLDNLIWGKCIVMEKNARTAKAYFRSNSVRIDGSRTDFDGSKFGLRRYGNVKRDETGETIFDGLGEGLDLRVDPTGDVLLRTSPEMCTVWISRGMKSEMVERGREVRLFDLRSFKNSLLERETNGDQRRNLLSESIVYIKFTPAPALSCPLWFCLVHLIAVELTTMLHPIGGSSVSTEEEASSSVSSTRSKNAPLHSPYTPSTSPSSHSSTPPPPPILKNGRNHKLDHEYASVMKSLSAARRESGGSSPKTSSSILRYSSSSSQDPQPRLAKLSLPPP
ncbi:hypothetical protein PENTCL1PPCAC_26625, partial [Pristionchus entomophagus]